MPFFCLNRLSFGLRFRNLRNLLCKLQTVALVNPCFAAILKSGAKIHRLRQRCWVALRRRICLGVFSSKKGQWLNHLKSLNPKRQIQTVNRQERAIYRQKRLALLSVVCQCPDCSLTKSKGENDG